MKAAINIALLLATFVLSGCGINMPEATKKIASPEDVVGEWKYPLTTSSGEAHIIFRSDGFYDLTVVNTRTKTTTSKKGTWKLDGSSLILTPFYALNFIDPTKLEQHDSITWFLTDIDNHTLAPFGGDCIDPDNWGVLSRIK